MREISFVEKVRAKGGKVYVTGGWVRDYQRGAVPKDKDYVLTGLKAGEFQALFPEAICVGFSFPVFLLSIEDQTAEVALARRERKQGTGYRGFWVQAEGDVTIEEDLFRRDTTINSMAVELPEERLIDPYGGQRDIENRVIRAVSPHFSEDPVRALRAARQAAEFGFTVASETISYMAACRKELVREPGERIFGELKRALLSPQPSIFFRVLQKADLLASIFPELHALIGKTQPVVYHPEGDAFEHTMAIIDGVAQETTNPITRFAALAHDLGKGTTPKEMEPHHYGHEERGLNILEAWGKRLPFPRLWLSTARFVVAEHMRAPRLEKPGKIVKLLLALSHLPIGAAEFSIIIKNDHKGLPEYLAHADDYLRLIQSVHGGDAPAGLTGKAVGAWIFAKQISLYKNASRKAILFDGKSGFA